MAMINREVIIEQLRTLKLHGMAEAFGDIEKLPLQTRPSLEMAVAKMIEAENLVGYDDYSDNKVEGVELTTYHVNIEDIICSTARNLTQEQLSELAECGFIRRGENLLITGKTGCGKSYLACALARQACMLGLRALYLNMNRFAEILGQARLDGTFTKMLNRLNKIDVIVFDDFGLQKMSNETRLSLLSLLEDRYAVIIASQLPLDKWYDYLAEPTLADAIMDRLVNTSHHVSLEGPSLRGKRKTSRK